MTEPALGAEPAVDADSLRERAVASLVTARERTTLLTTCVDEPDLTAQHCPELPPVWVVAQVEAESGWDAIAVGGGVAGLLQFDELTWTAAGGAPWPSATPGPGDPVTRPCGDWSPTRSPFRRRSL